MTEHLKREFERRFLETDSTSDDEIAAKTAAIYAAMLRESDDLGAGNFNSIHPDDLRRMFRLYDDVFFQRHCKALLGEMPLDFRLSKRMTRAAGKTGRFTKRGRDGTVKHYRFEIAISTTLLYQTFQGEERPREFSRRPHSNTAHEAHGD